MKIKTISIKLAMIFPLLSLSLNADADTLKGYDNLNVSASVQRLGFDESSSNISFSKTRYAGYDEYRYPDYGDSDDDDDDYDDHDDYDDSYFDPPVGARGR